MPSSATNDPRIPGPATKPVEKDRRHEVSEPMVDPVLHPVPEGAGVGRADRDLVGSADPGPLAADDPRAHPNPNPASGNMPSGFDNDFGFGDDDLDPFYDASMAEDQDMYDDYYDDDQDESDRDGSLLEQGVDMIRRNPVGTGLVLAGLALLAAPRLERETVRRRYTGVRDNARAHMDEHRRDAQTRLRSLRDRLSEGTEDMSAEARKRVIAARERALEAKERTVIGVRRATARMDGTMRRNPLMTGAVALAAGAALGAALPRTQVESNRLGRISSRLMDEARDIFEEERARVMAGASAAADEVRNMANEAAQAARDAVPDGKEAVARSKDILRDSAERVAAAAKSAADESKQNGKATGASAD